MSPGGAMVGRLLLIAVVATLAVALPASAQDDPSDPEDPGPEPLLCAPFDPCSDESASQGPAPSCQTLHADPTASPGESISVDPDGCLREFIRRALGWPPVRHVSSIGPVATILDLL